MIQDSNSSLQATLCGVPQGSILGPLLFLVYVNDMESAVSCKLFLYADDSVLVSSGKDIPEIEKTLSSELSKIQSWLVQNRLSLHIGKTESILFGSKQKLKQRNFLEIKYQDSIIKSQNAIKYLGVTLDQNMSGASHAKSVIQKVNQTLKFLYRNSSFLFFKEKKMICSALMQPRFDYGCNSWYRGLDCSLKHKLQTAQNKIMRMMGLLKFIEIGS